MWRKRGTRDMLADIPHWPQRSSRVSCVFYPQRRNWFVVARHPFEDWDPEFLVSSSAARIYLYWMKIYFLLFCNIYKYIIINFIEWWYNIIVISNRDIIILKWTYKKNSIKLNYSLKYLMNGDNFVKRIYC